MTAIDTMTPTRSTPALPSMVGGVAIETAPALDVVETPPEVVSALALLMSSPDLGVAGLARAGEEWVKQEVAVITATERVRSWLDVQAVQAAVRLQDAVTDATAELWLGNYEGDEI